MWQDAHELVLKAYRVSGQFPISERYGLSSQLQRAAVSVAANIAEGSGRRSRADFRRFIDFAAGSTSEVQYYSKVAADLGLVDDLTAESLRSSAVSIRRQLHALARTLADRR